MRACDAGRAAWGAACAAVRLCWAAAIKHRLEQQAYTGCSCLPWPDLGQPDSCCGGGSRAQPVQPCRSKVPGRLCTPSQASRAHHVVIVMSIVIVILISSLLLFRPSSYWLKSLLLLLLLISFQDCKLSLVIELDKTPCICKLNTPCLW